MDRETESERCLKMLEAVSKVGDGVSSEDSQEGVSSAARRYLEIVEDSWYHADGSECRARSRETCPFEMRAEKSDRDITRELYAKAKKDSVKTAGVGIGDTSHFDRTDYGKRSELASRIDETGLNVYNFAASIGVPGSIVYGLLTGTINPVANDGKRSYWTRYASRVSAGLNASPDEVFPVEADDVDPVPFDAMSSQSSPGESPAESSESSEMSERIRNVLSLLSDNQRKVLTMHYGLDGRDPMTLSDIGRELGRTKERIRQIEDKGLKELRNHPKLCMELYRFTQGYDEKDDAAGKEEKKTVEYDYGKMWRDVEQRSSYYRDHPEELPSCRRRRVRSGRPKKDSEKAKMDRDIRRWNDAMDVTRIVGGNKNLSDSIYGFMTDSESGMDSREAYKRHFGEHGFPSYVLRFSKGKYGVRILPRYEDEGNQAKRTAIMNYREISGDESYDE